MFRMIHLHQNIHRTEIQINKYIMTTVKLLIIFTIHNLLQDYNIAIYSSSREKLLTVCWSNQLNNLYVCAKKFAKDLEIRREFCLLFTKKNCQKEIRFLSGFFCIIQRHQHARDWKNKRIISNGFLLLKYNYSSIQGIRN